MSIFDKDVALKKTLQDYCDNRDAVIAMWKHGAKAFKDASELASQCVQYAMSCDAGPRLSESQFVAHLDSRYWSASLDLTRLSTIMDAKAMKQFRDSLGTSKMPEFTIDSVQATFLDMFQRRDEMFGRGCWEVFRGISRGKYISNDKEPYSVGKGRLILSYWFEPNYSGGRRVGYHKVDAINDIDRIFRVLDGKPANPRGFESEMNAFFGHSPDEMFENEYFKVRAFGNQNGHIWFKRHDLVDKLNDTIAAYCGGNAIPSTAEATRHETRPTERYEPGVPHGSV